MKTPRFSSTLRRNSTGNANCRGGVSRSKTGCQSKGSKISNKMTRAADTRLKRGWKRLGARYKPRPGDIGATHPPR